MSASAQSTTRAIELLTRYELDGEMEHHVQRLYPCLGRLGNQGVAPHLSSGVWLSQGGNLLAGNRPTRQQFSFFVPSELERTRDDNLMATFDAINERFGRSVLRLAAEGGTKHWQMRRGNLSPRYTTAWDGVATVAAV